MSPLVLLPSSSNSPALHFSKTAFLSSFLTSIHPAVLFLSSPQSYFSFSSSVSGPGTLITFLRPRTLHPSLSFHLSASLSVTASHPCVANFCFCFCQHCHFPPSFSSFHLLMSSPHPSLWSTHGLHNSHPLLHLLSAATASV